jgi:dTDP-4-dehydrorhamnose 3,5-epimerase
MQIKQLKLSGVFEITPSPHEDARGFFMRTFDEKIFADDGLQRHWVQENHSRSEGKGIIRGLHLQFPPHSETKLVRCIRGSVLDVFVDLRKGSPSFGKWGSIELSEQNKKMVFIPKGFAHGFCTLTAESEVLYKVDDYYHPESEGGILWSDKDLSIPWPVNDPIISDKDSRLPTLREFIEAHGGIDLIDPRGDIK